MTDPTRDDPASHPALGRALMALGRPGAGARVTWALGAVCLVLLAADFLYHKHVYLAVEEVQGFYPFVGYFRGKECVNGKQPRILMSGCGSKHIGCQTFIGKLLIQAAFFPSCHNHRQNV